MTRDEAKKFLPLIQAFAEGKNVQMNTSAGWKDVKNPTWSIPTENYRIAADPLEQAMEIYDENGANCPSRPGIKAVLEAIKDGTIVL